MQWIDQCLNSIVNQSEVVVVDNNSSDNTLNHIKQYFPSVKILAQTENLGFGKANNIGIGYALNNGAEAIFLLNQDAHVEKECIIKLVKAHKENPEFGIISPIHLNGDGSEVDYSFLIFTSPYKANSLISDLIVKNFSKNIYEISFINAAAWFIPKDIFYKVGGFDPLFFFYGEDDNYCQRVLYHSYKIGIIPNATIYHDSKNHSFKENTKGSKEYYKQFKNNILVKYANINTQDYKKINKLKFYLLKKALINFLSFDVTKGKIYLKKYELIDKNRIVKSVQTNLTSNPNYLNDN